MANLFYGVSTTEPAIAQKEVIIYNPLHDEIIPGDLLAVYFSKENTVESPTLVIGGTSLSDGENNQTSLSEDAGIIIKTRNVDEEVDYMWQAGEVCIFVLVSQQTNSDLVQEYDAVSQTDSSANDALYYMLVRGARANSEFYGLTKLFTDSFGEGKEYVDFKTWLATEDAPEDKTTAATPYLIKQLSNFIIGKLTPEPEPTPTPEPDPPEPTPPEPSPPEPTPVLQIEYEQTASEDTQIGILRVGETLYNIYIPNTGGGSGGLYSKTSQFTNDADIENNGLTYGHKRGEPVAQSTAGYYFITNVVDNNLYLYKPAQTTGIYVANPLESGEQANIKSPVEGDLKTQALLTRENSNNYTVLNDGFRNSALYVKGYPQYFYSTNEDRALLTLDKTGHSSAVSINAPSFIEGGVALTNKYSRILEVRAIKIGLGSTSAANTGTFMYWAGGKWNWGRSGWTKPATATKNSTTGHMKVLVNGAALQNVTPLGIVGYNIDYSSHTNINTTSGGNSGDATYQTLWELFLTNSAKGQTVINYNTRNTANRTVYFSITVYLLVVRS